MFMHSSETLMVVLGPDMKDAPDLLQYPPTSDLLESVDEHQGKLANAQYVQYQLLTCARTAFRVHQSHLPWTPMAGPHSTWR